ncbi:unnamed protein product [Prorocentrum cordatum]|uniref:Mitochondrial import inner membrane translocase subunit n=1 Tax=Prorocentrum cordatum TaxID=2364126 RepID=A0ABN9WVS6_9DINO|nr:unnamed protein product [Polarella glacialis]
MAVPSSVAGAVAGGGLAEQLVFQARFGTEQSKVLERLCWERCIDTLQVEEGSAPTLDRLPERTGRCLDTCVHKFTDTAVLVSTESEFWQACEIRKAQQAQLAARAVWGGATVACTLGVCCYLFRGSHD